MRWIQSALTVALGVCAACGSSTSATLTTGLTGVVVRGPITPVCQVSVPCDAPFSAAFTVERNGDRIDQFRSDSEGRFTVWLQPGAYRIVPNPDAPLLAPASQAKTVDVGAVGLTTVRLEFDTGIR